MITELIAKTVIRLVAKQFKLDKILSYVEDPNDADKRIDDLELDLFGLKQSIKALEKANRKPKGSNKKIKEKK